MSKKDISIAHMRNEAQRIYYQRQKIKQLEQEKLDFKKELNTWREATIDEKTLL